MPQGKWEYSITFLFIVLSILLLIAILVQYMYGASYRSDLLDQLMSEESQAFMIEETPDYQFSPRTIDDYHQFVERPLFFKERQPIIPSDEDEETTTVASGKFAFVLTGVIDTPTGIYCLLQNPRAKEKSEKFKRLQQGDEIDGWIIKEIHPDHVTISANGTSEEIKLAKPRLNARAMQRRRNKQRRKANKAKKRTNPFERKTKNKR